MEKTSNGPAKSRTSTSSKIRMATFLVRVMSPQPEFQVNDPFARIVVVPGDGTESQRLIQRARSRHRRQGVQAYRAVTKAPRVCDDSFRQFEAQLAPAKFGSYKEPFHFADTFLEPSQRDAAGGLKIHLREQQLARRRSVLTGQSRDCFGQAIKTFTVAGRLGVFAEQRPHLFDLRGRRCRN